MHRKNAFALPVRNGGLNLVDPAAFVETQYRNSLKVTKPLTDLIIAQCFEYPYKTLLKQLSMKKEIKLQRCKLGQTWGNSNM